MDYLRDPSSHWNSYRPTYSPSPREQRGPHPHPAPTSSRGHGPPCPNVYGLGAHNPNMVPVTPRYFSSYTSPDRHPNHDHEHSYSASAAHPKRPLPPQLWDPALDDLMGRTTRAYDLVINYERDSEGGKRWSVDDITRIHETGKHLHSNIRTLKAWQRRAAADWDYFAIQDDEDVVRQLCAAVQGVIAETENKTDRELIMAGTPLVESLAQGGHAGKQDDDDKNKNYSNGQEHSKMGMSGLNHHRKADRHSHPQKRSKVVKRRSSPQRAPRQRQAQETESYRPNGNIVAGRLGNHVLHY